MPAIAPLLFAILFEAPLSAAAVAGTAVSIPILIHLLNRRRFRVVEWAAMRFLLTAQRKNARRMRLEQWLLLLVRCLIVLLLVLAMASVSPWAEALWRRVNPEGGKGIVASSTRTHRILVLDGSFSMAVKSGEQTAFARARALAEQIVEEGAGTDGFSVVLMAAPPRRIVAGPSEDARKVASEIRKLSMTHGNADLPGTLATVAGLLEASPGKYAAREVTFLTDLQRSSWIPARPGDLALALQAFQKTRARAVFVDVGRDGVSNLAVTGLELADPVATTLGKLPLIATLHNHGDSRDDVPVRLLVGKARGSADDRPVALREVAATAIRARRGQQTPVAFTYQFPAPGDYVVQVATAHDELEVDDVRSAIVRVRNHVPVMLVNGKPANEVFDRATEWLRVALNPFDDATRAGSGMVFRPKVLSQFQFADEKLGDLSDFDAVYLCDVPRLSAAEVRRLETHVRRGGAVILSMGDRVDPGAYNDALYRDGQGLLPARLLGVQRAPAGYAYQLALDPDADRREPLRMFQDASARERLLAPHFSAFMQTEPARPQRGVTPARVLGLTPLALPGTLRSSLSAPPPAGTAVWEWQPPLPATRLSDAEGRNGLPPGRGRVLLVTTTLNSDWNRWPVSPAFPPLMQELLYHAAGPRLRERALSVGEPIEIHLGAAGAVEATIETPRDPLQSPGSGEGVETLRRLSSQPFGDASVLRFGETETSGIYKILIGADTREHLFAVNVPAAADDQQGSESNLGRTTADELTRTFPEWELQVVTELRQIKHAAPVAAPGEVVYAAQGHGIARWLLLVVLGLVLAEVLLAWQFGHHSAGATAPGEQTLSRRPGVKEWALAFAPWLLFTALGAIGFILLHDAWSGDFLTFLPEGLRGMTERAFSIPPPAPGEGSRWRLEYSSYLRDARSDPWLVGTLLLFLPVGVALVYAREGQSVRPGTRLLLVGLRVGLLVLLLVVFLPQLRLYFERQGWPDVVLLLDDSQSMAAHDLYRDEPVKEAAGALARRAELSDDEKAELARALAGRSDLTPASRLRLAQTLLVGQGDEWLQTLLTRRKVRLHVYRCSGRAQRLADATSPEEVRPAVEAIAGLRAAAAHDSSQLGTAVRQVLNDFRGSSLAALIMLTDGVTTEGEDLGSAARYAAQMGVPLFFVGIGDAHETRDLFLHDLQVEDSVYVNDRLVFELRLTAAGYSSLTVPVTLHEKGKDQVLDAKTVTIDPNSRTVRVRLTHRPSEAGEKVYVVRVPARADENDRDNNALERPVHVREARQIKVLYVEGYRRYEYHYLKSLLERESARVRGNKSVNLKVVLLDADADFAAQDRTALPAFPTPFRSLDAHTRDDDLWSYDVVILGDIDPEPRDDNKMAENLKNLADFVSERGGGLLVLGGERFSPRALRTSPLRDVLPIDLTGERVADGTRDGVVVDTYRPELTPIGKMHPIFRFSPDEKESEEIWGRLKEFYWFADGYVPKRAAEVLATHPVLKGAARSSEKHPLVLQQFAGAGRCLFFGFSELWRWNWREDQAHYNQFWIQTIRYLARARLDRIELRLDRQTPYRRGEPIKATVRFPDDDRAPGEKTEVKVVVERRVPGRPGDKETRTLQLSKVEGSRGSFETILTQTPEGDYRFWLSDPDRKPRPQVECRVLAPPGEMERLRMNQTEMEQAAAASHGKFYTLASADRLLDDLPGGTRVTVNASGPPFLLWNLSLLFLLALGLLTTEWLLRKQKNLL